MRRWPISAAILLAIVATAILAVGTSAEDVYSERTLDIASRLQCPVCSGESVAASQVPISRQMRDTIERKVQAGESDQQIMDYFVQRYGEKILMDPPKSGFTLTLWWVPPFVLLIGALVVVLYFREGAARNARRVPATTPTHDDEELEALAREYLHSDTKPRPS